MVVEDQEPFDIANLRLKVPLTDVSQVFYRWDESSRSVLSKESFRFVADDLFTQRIDNKSLSNQMYDGLFEDIPKYEEGFISIAEL